MAKPKGVIKLRHRKEPHLEVHVYQDQETKKVKGHVVDYERGKVTSFEEKEEKPQNSSYPLDKNKEEAKS